jgi:hypothetical protein
MNTSTPLRVMTMREILTARAAGRKPIAVPLTLLAQEQPQRRHEPPATQAEE